MTSIGELFIQSKGQPVNYNGKIIQMVDCFPVHDGQQLRVIIEAAAGDWRQGISLTTKGAFFVNNQIIKNSVVLWADTAPPQVDLKIKTKNGKCHVKNVWDVGDGMMHSWYNGAAMIVEQLPTGRRYRCNDGRPNDDFSDIVFRVEGRE